MFTLLMLLMYSAVPQVVNATENAEDTKFDYTCTISADLGTLNIDMETDVNVNVPKTVEPHEEFQVKGFFADFTFKELPFVKAIMDNFNGQVTTFHLHAENAVNADDRESHLYNVAGESIDIPETKLFDGQDTVSFAIPQAHDFEAGTFIAGEDGEVVLSIGDIEMFLDSDLGELPVECTLNEDQDHALITIPVAENDGEEPEPVVTPEIELLGDNPVVLEVGDEFIDPGAIAKDDQGNDLTDRISVAANINTEKAGGYIVKYTVNDANGNTAIATRRVIVQDHVASGKTNYVALGDSLAAGYLNVPDEHVIGKGYPYFIKHGIEDNTNHQIHLINRSFGGFTTANILVQLENNTSNILQKIEEADFITYDAGANDLMGAIDIGNLDDIDEETAKELLQIGLLVLEDIKVNIDESLKIIHETNPDASVYVMGYYNALPWVEGEAAQELIETGIGLMNEGIREIAEENDAIYVPTWDAFTGKSDEYLPNPDIHPNEAGYQAIADEFLQEIIPNLEERDTEPPIITLNGDEAIELEVGDTYEEMGATAYDDVDGDLTDAIEISGEVDTDKPGEYHITYTVSDAAGNVAEAVRRVTVVESATDDDDTAEGGMWFSGEGKPAGDLGATGDLYLDEINYDIYKKDQEGWARIGNLKGSDGQDGVDGATWLVGEGVPDDDIGEEGDLYLDESGFNVYKKEDKGWRHIGNLKQDSDCDCDDADGAKKGGENGDSDASANGIDDENGNGGSLPETATNHPLFILTGFMLVIFGGSLLIWQKKRKVATHA